MRVLAWAIVVMWPIIIIATLIGFEPSKPLIILAMINSFIYFIQEATKC